MVQTTLKTHLPTQFLVLVLFLFIICTVPLKRFSLRQRHFNLVVYDDDDDDDSVSGWTRGVQVKLWDPLRTRAIPERFRGVFMTRRYTNTRLPCPLPYLTERPEYTKMHHCQTKNKTLRRGSVICMCVCCDICVCVYDILNNTSAMYDIWLIFGTQNFSTLF